MRSRVFFFVFFLLFFVLIIFTANLYVNNFELTGQIEERDKLIKESHIRDSITNVRVKQNADTVTKYFNDCSLEIDGKKITLDKFIGILNESYNRNNELHDSLSLLKIKSDLLSKRFQVENYIARDSLQLTKFIIESIKRRYKIEFTIKEEKGYRIFEPNFSPLDSAIILLPHFRDKLSYDSTIKGWRIVVQKPR